MNFGRAFSFMFEDREALRKILVGGFFTLLSYLVIGIPFVFGYLLELMKDNIEGKETPLPEWDQLGEKFVKGLVFLLIVIIYIMPAIIVNVIPCLGQLLSFIYGIALWLAFPYIMGRFALSGKFTEAFQFDEIIEFVKKNIENLILALVMSIVISIISAFGIILLMVGVLFTTFWAGLGCTHLYAQVFRAAKEKS
ncbi:MAG: DUF4013 domain-containing protein [Candidatus Edwardsbacteria bacterium]